MSATKVNLIDNDGSSTRNNDDGSGYDDDVHSNYDHSDDSDYDVYDDFDYTDDNDNEYDTCDEGDNSDANNDTLCALCDDGGNLISCIGQCKRSFHPRKKDGKESKCKTLGYTSTKLKESGSFICKNCEYKQHQCFKCGELEPSAQPNAKVFKCNNPSCGHFYHPKCVAKLLESNDSNDDESSELEKQIMEGIPFTCPMHGCFECGRVESRTRKAMQFATCRRCPKSYHIECLPREISFETKDKNIKQRAWNLPGTVIIYCLDHKICRTTGNAKRDHIKFPQTRKITKVQDLAKQKGKMVSNEKGRVDQCLVESINELNKLPRAKFEHTQNSLQHTVHKPKGSAMRLTKDLQIESPMFEDIEHCLKGGLQIEPSIVGATNQSSQITLQWHKKQPRSSKPFVIRTRVLSSDVGVKTKKRSSRTSYNSAKKCVDHPVEIARNLHAHLETRDTDNLLEDLPRYKDTELVKVTSKIPNVKDARKERSSMHLGEDDGATNEYTFHGNYERDDESGKLSMELYAKMNDNKSKSRLEIDMQLGENVVRHDSIAQQDDDNISIDDNQLRQSKCEQESILVKRKTARNGSTKSSGNNGGFAPYHDGDNPPEKLLHAPYMGNMVITNIIHNQPPYAYDKEQEVNGDHTSQHDPNSSQGNVTPKATCIDISSDKSRKKAKLMEKVQNRCNGIEDGTKIDLDDTERCNGIEDGKEAHCDHTSHQCFSNHKELAYQDNSFGNIMLDGLLCNDENKVIGITEYKFEESRGSSRRESLTNGTTEKLYNPLVGTNSHMEQRRHSPNGQMTNYDRYEQHHPTNNQHWYEQHCEVNHSSNGNYGPWSHVPLRPVLSPTEFRADRRRDCYSYLREIQHDSTRWQNPYLPPISPGYFVGGWHSSPYYPTRPTHAHYAQNANNFPIHGYDGCNNFTHVGYNAMVIAPTTVYPPLQLNSNGAYQPHTHVRMQGHGAAYSGHNTQYGVISHYTLSLGPHPQARRSVMDKYAPNLEQTNNQVRS